MIRPPRTPTLYHAVPLAMAIGLAWCSQASAQSVRTDFPVANGAVNVQYLSGNTLFVGGSFGYIGRQAGGGVPVDSVTGSVLTTFPQVNGTVSAVAPDGAGGWYVGGLFNTVNGVPRANLAHLLADYSLDAWNPGTDGQVYALATGGGVVYAGGAFSNAGGFPRSRLAAIDSVSGSATAWNPGANDLVRGLALHGSTLYVVGRFTLAGGLTRNRVAAFDTSSAVPTSWNPNAGSEVLAVACASGSVYLGGTFTAIGIRARNRVAQIDSLSGIATNWNPNANGQVNAIALSGTSLYAGGTFTTLGGATHVRIGEISLVTGVATSWSPSANGAVNALALDGASLYAAGDFTTIGTTPRSRIAQIDTGTGLALAWNPIAYGTVMALATNGTGVVYAGGSFGAMGGWARNNVAAIDAVSGAVLPWNPGTDGQVLSLIAHDGVLYIGGQFTTVAGQPRANAAAVDAATGALRPWNPSPSDLVTVIAANDTSVYLGGLFGIVAGQTRNYAARVDAAAGAALAWDPEPDGEVFEIKSIGGLVYLGGSFTFAGGQLRSNLAAVDPVSGAATAWNPGPNGTIRTLVPSCDRIYAGGFFTNIGGQNRNRIAALSAATGSANSWNPDANGQIFDMEVADGVLYAGGVFSTIGGQSRNRLAALDLATGFATSWNPNTPGAVRVLSTGDAQVFVGGSFTAVGSATPSNLAALSIDPTYGCPAGTVTPASLPDGVAGTSYAQSLSSVGAVAPTCWIVSDGTLPPGLSLGASGVLSGTPTGAAATVFTASATDARGCTSERTFTLATFGSPVTASIAPRGAGLCVNPAHPFVAIPIVYTRSDTTPVRLVSVTFQLDTAHLALHTPGSPGSSVQLGPWFDAFGNALLQVTDNGGGSYTADATLLGAPCGPTTGGTLLNVDVAATGPDGYGGITVTAVHVRDCSNNPVQATAGSRDSVKVQYAPLTIAPATLPAGTVGAAYHQALTPGGGTAPYAFALASGTLPPGLTLSAAGVLDGTPSTAALDTFTVALADSFGCAGQRLYSLAVACPALAISPGTMPDGLVGTPYSVSLAASGATPPLTWSVSAGALPAGLSLDGSSGVVSGTPTGAGTGTFTLAVTDAHGCGTSRADAFTIFAPPVTATLAANASGLCLSAAHTRVTVPFVLARTDTGSVRHARVSFQLDASRLALATPAAPDSSVHAGAWWTGHGSPALTATSTGAGAWTVDVTLPAGPCGPDSGGAVFTADVVANGPDGAAAIAVNAVKLIGCAGDTLPVLPGAPAALAVNHSTPGALTTLAASQVLSGNGGGPTTGITLAWSGASQPVALYRASWASYPTYSASAPPDSTLAPGGPWTLVASAATSPYVDHPGTRGFWYYVALLSDSCGNVSSVSNRTPGTLDYVAGDVSDGITPGTGNNAVGMEDMTMLGMNYGISGGTLAARGVQLLDVGPTLDGGASSRPVPDGRVDFEDLMIFSTDFLGTATAPAAAGHAATPLAANGAAERFELGAPVWVTGGDVVTVPLRLAAEGRLQGFSVQLAWDPAVLEPMGMSSGGFAEAQGAVLLSPAAGGVDAALLGRQAHGFAGTGTVATFTFRALRGGDPALRFTRILGRDAANQPLPTGVLTQAGVDDAPRTTMLLAPAPNPFAASVALSFSLAQAADAELVVFDLDGRVVRTLAHGRFAAGVHHLAWDGRDESHSPAAPGVYYVRFAAAGRHFTSRLVHLR